MGATSWSHEQTGGLAGPTLGEKLNEGKALRGAEKLFKARQELALRRFTVNPRRRIRQHNGEITSGAHKTKRSAMSRPFWQAFRFCMHSERISLLQISTLGNGPCIVWIPHQGMFHALAKGSMNV